MKQKLSLKARALNFLSKREYSARELALKLQPYATENDDIEAIISWLQEKNFLSEERFVESYVRQRISRYGNQKILYDLQNYHIVSPIIEEITETLKETELARALALWKRRFGKPPQTIQEKAKQIRFLQYRGFPLNIIQKIIKGDFPDYD